MTRSRAAARRMALRRLLARRAVASQEELAGLLAREGFRVTQTTISRDLAALGAGKVEGPRGRVRYAVVDEGLDASAAGLELSRMLREFVVDIAASGNLVVVRTPPGAASPVALAVDAASPRGVLGTVAGDDTILVVASGPSGGGAVARDLTKLMEVRS